MASLKLLQKCVLSTTELRKRMSPFKKNDDWKTTQYYAELYQRVEAMVSLVIRCYETATTKKKYLRLKKEIEIYQLESISLKPPATAEKHKQNIFICIDDRAGENTFLAFDTTDKRDEWYTCIYSVLTPKSITAPHKIQNIDSQKDLIKKRTATYKKRNDGSNTPKTKNKFTHGKETQVINPGRNEYTDIDLIKVQSNGGKLSERNSGRAMDSRNGRLADAVGDAPSTQSRVHSDGESRSPEDEAGARQPNNESIYIKGNNDTVIKALSGSTVNYCPKITIVIPSDVHDVDDSPPKKKPKLTDQVYSNIKSDTPKQPDGQESNQNEDILEQNRLLRQQNGYFKSLFKMFGKYGGILEDVEQGSIVFRVRFHNKEDLKRFWEAYASGELAEDLSQLLVTSGMEEEAGCNLKMLLHFDESVYKNALKALGTNTNAMTIQVESNNTRDSKQRSPDKPSPAKFPHVPESHSEPSAKEATPYKVLAIPEPAPSLNQHVDVASYQSIPSAVTNEYDSNTANNTNDDSSKPDEQPSRPSFNELTKTYTVEKISNVTNYDSCHFKVSGNCLEYDADNAHKRRIGLDELTKVEMNENLQVHPHKYENIICLETKERLIFLQTASRNEMRECYVALTRELRKSGWNCMTAATSDMSDSMRRRATSGSSLKRQHEHDHEQDRVRILSYGGYTRAFTGDTEKSGSQSVSSGSHVISHHNKVSREESTDVSVITRDTRSLQLQRSAGRHHKKKLPEVVPKSHRKFYKS